MLYRFKQYITRRRFGARAITSVALSSLFAGLLMASSVQWTPMSVAQGLDQSTIDGLLGTVAGDDTILIVATSGPAGKSLAGTLREIAGMP